MNLPLAESIAISILESSGLHTQGWEVKFTNLKHNFGVCNRPLRRISISKPLTLQSEPEALEATMYQQVKIARLEKFKFAEEKFDKGIDILSQPKIESKVELGNTESSSQVTNSKGLSEKEERWLEQMALLLIKKSSLPVSPRGKTGTLSIAVRENGQIGFSNSAGKHFDNFTHCTIGWDADSREMSFTPVNDKKLPKGVTAEDIFVVGQSKDGQRYISAAGLFKHDSIAYDYKYAGTHSFEATIDGSKMSYTLPEKMEPKPKVARAPRKAKGATAGATTGGATEPELQEA